MKEIGEQFKEKREEIGISIREVANDLKTEPIIIENLEEGNRKVFKDVLELKEISASYARYLGLDENMIIDQINDYLFEKTSKINLEDLKDRVQKKDENKIRTPYTIERNDESNKILLIVIFIVIVILVLFYVLLRKLMLG